nr:MAG TPA: helix-turn-helix domain protein [Caudoviricetes sp.]
MPQISLKAARVNVNLTQKEVAEKLGVHQQTIAKYEKDSTKIPMNLLHNLSELYKVKLDHIFLG